MTGVSVQWSVGVVIPARDEARTIGRTVDSVRRALDNAAHRTLATTIVVVADRCSDNTADCARSALEPDGVVIEASIGLVGSARAAGADVVATVCSGDPARTWIANTDGDTVVGSSWIDRQLDWADRGVASVTGIVRIDTDDDLLAGAFSRSYLASVTSDSHPHVHGANLGVRADVLQALGNWSSLATGEDHDLWHRLALDGQPTRHDPDLIVSTSGRLTGRAPRGFAADLVHLWDRAHRAPSSVM